LPTPSLDRPSFDENALPFPNDVTYSVHENAPFDCASHAFVSYKQLGRVWHIGITKHCWHSIPHNGDLTYNISLWGEPQIEHGKHPNIKSWVGLSE
jgi:hypothetical protein